MQTIYRPADIADELGMKRNAFSNMLSRRPDDVPQPTYVTPDGRWYWDERARAAWHAWHAARGERFRWPAREPQE